ncbi:MAG TPA: YrzE family protein [Gracilimonas sp.]|uniref:YrzE family protein n=1 Tax=Gracilimonas sp. TaxID=1974203 RepID=UPI002D9F3876|nr:YrzE family protein [Gracilimonas sp.]
MDNTNEINPYTHEPKKGVSWRAIFAGTLTVLSILLILNLIGLAIGLGTIEPSEENNPLSGIGTGAVIWWVVSNLIALFAGGFVAARVGVSLTNISGVVQGIMTWGLYALISAWILTTAVGTVISGVGSAVGGIISTTGQAAGDALAPVIEKQVEDLDLSLEGAKEQFYSLMRDAGGNPEEMQDNASQEIRDGDVEQAFRDAKDRLNQTFKEVDKEKLVSILVERTDMSRSEADSAVANVLADYESLRKDVDEFLARAKETAIEKGEKAAEAGAKAAVYMSIALILGLFAASLGGVLGVKDLRDDYETHYVHHDNAFDSHVHRGPHPSEETDI